MKNHRSELAENFFCGSLIYRECRFFFRAILISHHWDLDLVNFFFDLISKPLLTCLAPLLTTNHPDMPYNPPQTNFQTFFWGWGEQKKNWHQHDWSTSGGSRVSDSSAIYDIGLWTKMNLSNHWPSGMLWYSQKHKLDIIRSRGKFEFIFSLRSQLANVKIGKK